jgi:hypothetical protein
VRAKARGSGGAREHAATRHASGACAAAHAGAAAGVRARTPCRCCSWLQTRAAPRRAPPARPLRARQDEEGKGKCQCCASGAHLVRAVRRCPPPLPSRAAGAAHVAGARAQRGVCSRAAAPPRRSATSAARCTHNGVGSAAAAAARRTAGRRQAEEGGVHGGGTVRVPGGHHSAGTCVVSPVPSCAAYR